MTTSTPARPHGRHDAPSDPFSTDLFGALDMETLDTLETPHADDIADCSPAGPCHGRRRASTASPPPHRHLWRSTGTVALVAALVIGAAVWADIRRDA
ncbi:MAG: hypothetical protein FWD11_02605, partial [Micrococcales bacterium]|nr:hypothetical protein [Micrococcales bacterium]